MAAIGPSGLGPSGNCGQKGWVGLRPPPRQLGHHQQQHLRSSSPLTLALPAPGPMGFMTVYMFSLELVESGEHGA